MCFVFVFDFELGCFCCFELVTLGVWIVVVVAVYLLGVSTLLVVCGCYVVCFSVFFDVYGWLLFSLV